MELTEKAFEEIFTSYYESLYGYAFSILREKSLAEETVSDVFYKLWRKREHIRINTTLPAYLYSSVHHSCMDNLRHRRVKKQYEKQVLNEQGVNSVVMADLNDFRQHLVEALNRLPEQCRTVFKLSREEELSYKEIAEHLGITVKTVETQMGRALKRLRVSLAEFLTLLIVCYGVIGC